MTPWESMIPSLWREAGGNGSGSFGQDVRRSGYLRFLLRACAIRHDGDSLRSQCYTSEICGEIYGREKLPRELRRCIASVRHKARALCSFQHLVGLVT